MTILTPLVIVFLPVIGGIVSFLMWKQFEGLSKLIVLLSLCISSIVSSYAFLMVLIENWENKLYEFGSWFPISGISNAYMTFYADELGYFMASIASFLGLLIGIFSMEYMKDDQHLRRYWFFFALFVSGMNLLVLAGDLIFLLIGWEIVGLCSFMLIGHWYYKPGQEGNKVKKAGFKAFIMTQVGDLGLIAFIIVIYQSIGDVQFTQIMTSDGNYNDRTSDILVICLMLAAFGKSAQFPFINWLSSPDDVDIDAMQGPTTVSALIHAATMVKAGVYLISRFYQLLPITLEHASYYLLTIGSITAVITGISAITSKDIKRILAYSTVSQLAYMFIGLGVAFYFYNDEPELARTAFMTVQVHLIVHAVFKSLLFLSAGHLIHHHHHQRSLTNLVGTANWKYDRVAFIGIIVGSFSLIGIPPLTGFFSKEKILSILYEAAEVSNERIIVLSYYLGFFAAILTALYSSRMLYYLVIRKSPNLKSDYSTSVYIKFPIYILSIFSLFGTSILFFGFLDTHINEILETIRLEYNVELLFTISIVLISIGLTLISGQKWSNSTKIEANRILTWFKGIADSGFYIDQLWNRLWMLLIYITFHIKKIHSGKLNSMMRTVLITSLVIGSLIIGV